MNLVRGTWIRLTAERGRLGRKEYVNEKGLLNPMPPFFSLRESPKEEGKGAPKSANSCSRKN